MQAVHHVHKVSGDVACQALHQLIVQRLLPDINEAADDNINQWLEKACVTCTLFATGNGSFSGIIPRLRGTFDAIVQRMGKPLSPKATHAMQTLIWKTINGSEAEVAESWCVLLKHDIFASAGQINKARIGR
jgi:hypothetical protein